MAPRTFRLRAGALAGATGRGVRIAIIDSGVHAAHPHVQGVAGGAAIDPHGREHADVVDRLGHGTAVTAVIREKAPDAEILAVKVFDRELRTSGQALAAALAWSRRARVRLVNLSLGTTNPEHADALADEVRALASAGVGVVAAGPQDGVTWLPGALPGVVAVTLDMGMPRDAADVTIGDRGDVQVRASGYPRPIPGVPPERNLKGLSFAVANATGLLALALEGAPVEATIVEALQPWLSTPP
jgi:subtilisin family serine protease